MPNDLSISKDSKNIIASDRSGQALYEGKRIPHNRKEAAGLTLHEACKILSISLATGRNWVRLGKLRPLSPPQKPQLFSKDEIERVLAEINSANTKVLKSRRNKKKITGNTLYRGYVKDREIEKATAALIEKLPSEIDERHIRVLLANIVIQLALQAREENNAYDLVTVQEYINGKIDLSFPSVLIDDILGNPKDTLNVLPGLQEALKIRFKDSPDDDILGFVYMSLGNLGAKKLSGAYYTPAKTADRLLEKLKGSVNLDSKTCLDPCCGSGNFLLGYSKAVNSAADVYGQDIDELAVMLTRANFALKHGINDVAFLYEHFTVGDSLFDLPQRNYDVIIGNPPWGYDFSEDTIRGLRQKYRSAASNGIESYDLFVERALSILPQGGIFAFVLPEAILNVKTHKIVREIMIDQGSFSFVSFIGNAFPGVQCPSVILGMKKGSAKEDIRVSDKSKEHIISGNRRFTCDNINLRSSNAEWDCLEAIAAAEGKTTLKGNAIFALGIVTGNNKQAVRNRPEDGCEIVLKGSDIKRYRYTPGGLYIRFTPEKFQQVAPEKYYRAPEKLLYRFICSSPVFAYDDRQTLTLNSCNILIPRFPGLSTKYILAILNSRVADFFCRQTFNSVKLLRSHIEQIPIPIPDNRLQRQIITATDDILAGVIPAAKACEEIDSLVMDLYGLSPPQKEIIRNHTRTWNHF